MVIGIKLLAFQQLKEIRIDNLLIVPLKIVEHLQLLHVLEKSKGMSCHPLIKSVNYLNSTKNNQYKVAMHVRHVKENNVSLSF